MISRTYSNTDRKDNEGTDMDMDEEVEAPAALEVVAPEAAAMEEAGLVVEVVAAQVVAVVAVAVVVVAVVVAGGQPVPVPI
ncbi:MAG: hypothetical protein PHU70_05035 [Dehalococcoidia bacterium]|nr:hypothetical protein [Dehalococcoidia bacterium]